MSQAEALKRIKAAEKEGKTNLDLSGLSLAAIPKELGKLTNLTELNLSDNQLSELPAVIGELTNLTSLYLIGNQLSELPAVIGELTNLTSLYLSYNQLSELPAVIGELTNLTSLYLSYNQLSELPAVIGELTNLTSLDLRNNQLSELPAVIGELTNLTSLDLRNNQLSELPAVIGELTNLTSLYLSSNQLSELPAVIGELTNLTSLYLTGNQLSELPAVIGELTNLTSLDLRGNQLGSLSPSLLKLNLPFILEGLKIKGIFIEGNPLQSPPIEIIKQGREAIEAYFAGLEEKEQLREVKLLLVGDGGAGKTSLVKRFLGKRFNKKEQQTDGINIDTWEIDQGEDKIKVHIWDFGGQEIMHATHQFFLSKRSLYIVVLDGRRDEKAEYWLKHVENFGGDSPILVVLNKIDQNPSHEVDRLTLQKKYPGIKNFFRVSCANKTGVKELEKAIIDQLNELEMLQSIWPKAWFNVKQIMEKDNEPYLDHEKYRKVCVGQGITDEKIQKILVQYLHDLGVAIHFDSFHLEDTYVLDPHWVTEAVYRIINADGLAEANGNLELADLGAYLKKRRNKGFTYKKTKHSFFLKLMEEFELSYPIGKTGALVPDLLPVETPKYDVPKKDVLRLRIKYEFLPRLVIPRFIVKRHKEISNGLQWRTGVILENKNYHSKAFIKADYEERRIDITIWGGMRREYLTVIRETFRDINEGFQKNDIEYGLSCNCEICTTSDDPYFFGYDEVLGFYLKGLLDLPCKKSFNLVPISLILEGVFHGQAKILEELRDDIKELKIKDGFEGTQWDQIKETVSLKVGVLGLKVDLLNILERIFSRK